MSVVSDPILDTGIAATLLCIQSVLPVSIYFLHVIKYQLYEEEITSLFNRNNVCGVTQQPVTGPSVETSRTNRNVLNCILHYCILKSIIITLCCMEAMARSGYLSGADDSVLC